MFHPVSKPAVFNALSTTVKNIGERAKVQPICTTVIIVLLVTAVAATAFAVLGVLPLTIGLSCGFFALEICVTPLLFFFTNPSASEKLYKRYRQKHTLENVKGDSVVIVFRGQIDHNGSLKTDQRASFKSLEKAGHELVFADVNSYLEVIKTEVAVKKAHKQIRGIIYHAHGYSNGKGIALCEDNEKNAALVELCSTGITKENVDQLADCFSLIEPGSPIILKSCEAAKEKDGVESIALLISEIAPECIVYAPKATTSKAGFKIVNPKTLEVEFYKRPKIDKKSKFRKLKKFYYEFIQVITSPKGRFARYHRNVTAVYMNGSPAA